MVSNYPENSDTSVRELTFTYSPTPASLHPPRTTPPYRVPTATQSLDSVRHCLDLDMDLDAAVSGRQSRPGQRVAAPPPSQRVRLRWLWKARHLAICIVICGEEQGHTAPSPLPHPPVTPSPPDACSPYPCRSQAPARSRCRCGPGRRAAEHAGGRRP